MDTRGERIKREFEQNDAVCERVIDLFQLVSSKSRFRMLCILNHGEFCVNDIANILGETKLSNVSQQLRILHLAGMVAKRREHKHVYYRLADHRFHKMMDCLRENYLDQEEASL